MAMQAGSTVLADAGKAGREAAIADDRETMRRAVRAALRNGQLEEIMDEDMLSCWSCEAGDRLSLIHI